MILLLESVPIPDLILETVSAGWPSTPVYRGAVGTAGRGVPTPGPWGPHAVASLLARP